MKIQEMLSSVFLCSKKRKINQKNQQPNKQKKILTDKAIKLNRKLIPQIMNAKAAASSTAVN